MPLRETKIAPVFFIGLGGCGGTIVDELARKVKQEESFENYKELIHFFALDTDHDDLSRLHWVDTAHKFVLSDFDKPGYVDLKSGKLHAKADELFTQWWPEWYRPRDTRGKGAGQIRLESRLAFYHHLENDDGKILETFNKAIRRAYDIHNPFRANTAARIYIYASLAGGTGSGGFAMVAYTIRRLLGGERGHQIIGTFVMPSVFKSKGLPPNQFDKIMANGYSALQEMELLQSASPALPIEFHYDPDHPEHVEVDRPAFDQVYLIEDKTAQGVVISDSAQVYNAIADAAHTQIFSTILDKEGSTLDNDTRELMQLDEQMFTKGFGSFGISALVLPDADILEYCSLRLSQELLARAVPGGVEALGDGTDIDAADKAFVRGVEDRAASGANVESRPFQLLTEWVSGGADSGEGSLGAFLRRAKEDVAKNVDRAIKLRDWEETELHSFEKDPERVQSELNSGWTALKNQIARGQEEATRRAQRDAAEVIAGTGSMTLADITRGRGPTDSRYFYVKLRHALAELQDEARTTYDRALSYDDSKLSEEFRRRVDQMKAAAPESLTEKIPGRDNDYFGLASEFANWYRDTLRKLRRRIRANAMLEFYSVILADLDRRRDGSLSFFARIDRITHLLEDRADRLLAVGARRTDGSDANLFVLDVEVLMDHRTGRRLWDHLYQRLIQPADFQLSGALGKLAELAQQGGAEQDIQRRIVDSLLAIASQQLRPRISGSRDHKGLRLDDQLLLEAQIVCASRRLEAEGQLPAVGDPAWTEEIKRVSEADTKEYIKDKLDFAAGKCQPFITLAVGAPYLPEKAFCVMNETYIETLGDALADLASLKFDTGQMIPTEDTHQIIFYKAQLGCALHAIKSLVEYERRYFAVKTMEIEQGSKMPGHPKGAPQIPLHQDANWEGAPDKKTALFRISIEGVKEDQSKLAWAKTSEKAEKAANDALNELRELRDFALGLVFGHITHREDGEAGPGYYMEDPDLRADDQRLGKFRDQAFRALQKRADAQKDWLRKSWEATFDKFNEDRAFDQLKGLFDAELKELDAALKNSSRLGGRKFSTHVEREKEIIVNFRRDRGV